MNAVCLLGAGLLVLTLGVPGARADVTPNPLFADNAVLQRGMRVPVWGTADPGEVVTVHFAGQSVCVQTAADGKWLTYLAALKPSGRPRTLTLSGKNQVVLNNILVGDVWVASGQSNMERQLGLREGQKPITDWEREARTANFPEIRHFGVAQTRALVPAAAVKGHWAICSPKTVTDFTAVGYFFARSLYRVRRVPIGLIHSSWGGTPAEAWTSEAGLAKLADFAQPLAEVRRLATDPAGARRDIEERLERWYRASDPGSGASPPWSDPRLNDGSWERMVLPGNWEGAGHRDYDGTFWFRRTVVLPVDPKGADVELHLGAIDDYDTTFVNGRRIGATAGWDVPRVYRVPVGVLKRGANVIAVRVLDTGAGGGMWGGKDAMRLVVRRGAQVKTVPLAGAWSCRPGVSLGRSGWPPPDYRESASAPTVLYNGMIAPLVPYAIRGVIWYQGEANVGRERQYRTLFPALIADWRRVWGQADFPFLFVQIAPFSGMTPEIREAQLLAWQNTKNTAMVVTTDCGDQDDIHPAHKQPVGARLALAARALAYGEKIEFSGPVYQAMRIQGTQAVVSFAHAHGGLLAQGGPLKGFTVAGADKVFHPARAQIRGRTVVVSSAAVPRPVAVRYGWANVPDVNLFNRAGLPASPFRTDAK
jgi:sialate O-acetylesterase